ncbi:MAG: hypothetical protein GX066_03080 [Clostridiaceae bacterium]|nr:hypothetical protein [Clostridiaceae bacterium]
METLLNVMERQDIAKRIRKKGYVPGSIYGPGVDKNLDIQIERKTLNRFIKENPIGSKVMLQLDNNELPCIVKNIQYDLMNESLIHIDFYACAEN